MIEIKHLQKSFENSTPLKDVNLEINKGDIISIIGPSGCGKSTLLRCINLLEKPTHGEIIFKGQNILEPKYDVCNYRKKIGMVFQSFNLFSHLTVIENIMKPQLDLLKRTKQEAYDKAKELLKLVGLYDKQFSYPDELSGGQKQRIAIARTLAMDPELILFDEPTSALDPSLAIEVLEVIATIAKKGTSMIIVTHEMDFAKEISSRVIYLDEGIVYEEGSSDDIFLHPQKQKTKEFIFHVQSWTYGINSINYDFNGLNESLYNFLHNKHTTGAQIQKSLQVIDEVLPGLIMKCINPNEFEVKITVEIQKKSNKINFQFEYKGADFEKLKQMIKEDQIKQIILSKYGEISSKSNFKNDLVFLIK